MQRNIYRLFIFAASIEMIFISGCVGPKFYTNIPKGTKRLPEGYGLVYGGNDLCDLIVPSGINDTKMKIFQRGKRIDEIISTCQERFTFAPSDLFAYMVPTGTIDIETEIHNPLVSVDRELLHNTMKTTYKYIPGIYKFKTKTSIDIPADTAVYVGDLRYVKTLLKGTQGYISIRVDNIMRSYQAVPKSVRGSFDDSAKHHKRFFEKCKLMCSASRTELVSFTPTNYMVGPSGIKSFSSMSDSNTDKYASNQK